MKYLVDDGVECVDWAIDGYWNYYPADNFVGNEGGAALFESKQAV
ncbi:MAG: hypothetical protein ACTHYC_15220 [Sphingobacterium sp.]